MKSTRYTDGWIFFTLLIFFYSSFIYKNFADPYVQLFGNDSQQMVINSVQNDIKKNGFSHAGLMSNQYGSFDKNIPYFSQFGLQYKIYSSATLFFGAYFEVNNYMMYSAFRTLNAFLLAATLSLLCIVVIKRFSLLTGLGLALLLVADFWISRYSMNLYWFSFTLFIPYVLAWIFYDYSKRIHLFIVFVAILLKCLNGYEFISNIVLSLLIPLVYIFFCRKEPYALRATSALLAASKVIFAALLAFFVAMMMQFGNILVYTGNLQNSVNNFLAPIIYRTRGDVLGNHPTAKQDLRAFIEYFNNKFVFDIEFKYVLLGFLLISIVAFVFQMRLSSIFSIKTKALFLTTIVALLFSISWNTLAVGHMRYHLQVNSISFVIPFGLTLYIFCSNLIMEITSAFSLKIMAHLPAK